MPGRPPVVDLLLPSIPVRPAAVMGRRPLALTLPSVQRQADMPARRSATLTAPAPAPASAPAMTDTALGFPLAFPSTEPAASSQNAGAAAVEAGIAHWDADGSVVFHAPPDEAEVQRQWEAPPPPAPAPGSTPAPGTTSSPASEAPVVVDAAAAAAQPQWPGGLDWEELVHRLHEEIRWQLRAELRQDADRFGFGSGIR